MYILLMESIVVVGGSVAQITEMRWIANIEPDKRNKQASKRKQKPKEQTLPSQFFHPLHV